MKKTIIALLALSGITMGADDALYTLNDVDLGTKAWIEFTGQTLSPVTGVTVMLTMNDWVGSNGPIGWFTTETYSDLTDPNQSISAATFGWGATSNGATRTATTFTKGGSATGQLTSTSGYSYGKSSAFDTTLFLTIDNGSVKMYEMSAENTTNVVEVAATAGMNTGAITGLYIGGWNGGAPTNRGSMDVQIYSGIKDTAWMNSKLVPEPTTATLSLLALAGLAARRRRK